MVDELERKCKWIRDVDGWVMGFKLKGTEEIWSWIRKTQCLRNMSGRIRWLWRALRRGEMISFSTRLHHAQGIFCTRSYYFLAASLPPQILICRNKERRRKGYIPLYFSIPSVPFRDTLPYISDTKMRKIVSMASKRISNPEYVCAGALKLFEGNFMGFGLRFPF